MDVLTGDVELTEFEAIDVTSVKGVGKGANGFPILLMKGLSEPEPDAEPEGEPDDAAQADAEPAAKSGPPAWHPAAAQLARLAVAAPGIPRETLFKAIAADGSVDEQPDIDGGKQAVALIAKLIGYESQELEAGCMGEIWDIGLLVEAAGCLRSWLSGEVATQMAETSESTGVVMDSVAEEIPAAEPAAVAKDEADGQTDPQGTGDLSKAVEDAVTKATAPLKAEIESLQAFKAKVEALPVPGGPVMSLTRVTAQGAGGEDQAAKAAYYEQMAATVASPADADNYRQLAAQAKAKITS